MAISKFDKFKINHEGFIDVDAKDQLKISQIQENGKYMLDLRPNSDKSWIIRKNPNYATTRTIMWASVLSTICSFISLVIVSLESFKINSDLNDKHDRLKSEIQDLRQKFNSEFSNLQSKTKSENSNIKINKSGSKEFQEKQIKRPVF